MTAFSILALGQFIYSTTKSNPWRLYLIAIQKGAFLLCVIMFVLVSSLMKLGVKNQNLTLSLILLTLICIMIQLISLLYNLLLAIVSCCTKKKITPSRLTSDTPLIDGEGPGFDFN